MDIVIAVASCERISQRPGMLGPVRFAQSDAVPANLGPALLVGLTPWVLAPAQSRMSLAELDHETRKPEESAFLFKELPVDPADLIVLTIRIVVALLGTADLIAGGQHR